MSFYEFYEFCEFMRKVSPRRRSLPANRVAQIAC